MLILFETAYLGLFKHKYTLSGFILLVVQASGARNSFCFQNFQMFLCLATLFYCLVYFYQSVYGESFVVYIMRHNETGELVGYVCNITHLDYPVNSSDYTTEAPNYPTTEATNYSTTVYVTSLYENNKTTTELIVLPNSSTTFVNNSEEATSVLTTKNNTENSSVVFVDNFYNATTNPVNSTNSTARTNHTISWEESVRECGSIELTEIRKLEFISSANVTINCSADSINRTESDRIVEGISAEYFNLTFVDFHRVYENFDEKNITFFGARVITFKRSDTSATKRLTTSSDRKGHHGYRHHVRVHHQVFEVKGKLKSFSYTDKPTSQLVGHVVERGFTGTGTEDSWMFTVVYVA